MNRKVKHLNDAHPKSQNGLYCKRIFKSAGRSTVLGAAVAEKRRVAGNEDGKKMADTCFWNWAAGKPAQGKTYTAIRRKQGRTCWKEENRWQGVENATFLKKMTNSFHAIIPITSRAFSASTFPKKSIATDLSGFIFRRSASLICPKATISTCFCIRGGIDRLLTPPEF